jgi:hypothetical protein
MTRTSSILTLALSSLLLISLVPGCGERGPVTIVFSGDTEGRLVPAG